MAIVNIMMWVRGTDYFPSNPITTYSLSRGIVDILKH
jgi:hypothetical protein